MKPGQRIAIVGAGMSGLTTARILDSAFNVTLFEAADTIGGHAHVINIPAADGKLHPIDAGVCMFYTTGYPNFFRLLRQLKIPSVPSDTSTEILCVPDGRRFHFDLNAPWKTFATSVIDKDQRWLVRDGLRFYRHAIRAIRSDSQQTFAQHLEEVEYTEPFRIFLSFLSGATWTLNQAAVLELPLGFVARIFRNLGFLPAVRHGIWHHIPGSVVRYLDALSSPLRDRIRLRQKLVRVERKTNGLDVQVTDGEQEYCESFDHVIFAIPAQNALECLADPRPEEIEILSAFETQKHKIVFTSDEALMSTWTPNRPAIFAATDVNEQSMESGREFLFRIGFTDLSRMCKYDLPRPIYMWYQFPDGPNPAEVHASYSFSTPRFTVEALAAQRRHAEISGTDRVHFCGAGWDNGIHEGSVTSALAVAKWFGKDLDDVTYVDQPAAAHR